MAEEPDPRRPPRESRDPGQAREGLAPFVPPPPALLVQPGTAAAAPPQGSAQAQAEIASLIERLVTSFRLGRVGRDGTEIHMRLALRADAGVTARLRLENGELTAVLIAEAGAERDAQRLAAALEAGLREQGLNVAEVRVEPA